MSRLAYVLRAIVGRRHYDVELIIPKRDRPLIIRGIPERMIDSVILHAIEQGRDVVILKEY